MAPRRWGESLMIRIARIRANRASQDQTLLTFIAVNVSART